MAPTQGEYLTIEGPQAPYANGANAEAHTIGTAPPTKATVNTLHVRKYGGHGLHGPRATGVTATPTVFANGLAEAQMIRFIADIPMPKYSGNPEDVDKLEPTWNKCVNGSTMGCSEAQRQPFCLFMLLHCVPANVKKELVDGVEDGKVSTCDEKSGAPSARKERPISRTMSSAGSNLCCCGLRGATSGW